ncbi:MAG: deoxyadenosine/deoxycytidine kinase [Arenicella sp.]|jgi:deoxyadenosine/deoxycytidine kinase
METLSEHLIKPMEVKNTPKNIIIEGPIGVGKSSLSEKLAASLGSSLLLEKPTENPFLERFYKSPKRYSLPTQLFFLFQRVQQLADAEMQALAGVGQVSDFMLAKDQMFAQLTLDAEEAALYQQVYQSLCIDAPKPDLMIYLQAPVATLQSRIKKRSIKYEQSIETAYLEKLSDAYTNYFHHYTESPLLIVNAADINPIDNDDDYHALLNHITRIDAGKHFFNPLSV